MHESLDHITTCTCDDCGAKVPGVVVHHYGEPVMFLCKPCAPRLFEGVARRQIDAWLTGAPEAVS